MLACYIAAEATGYWRSAPRSPLSGTNPGVGEGGGGGLIQSENMVGNEEIPDTDSATGSLWKG